MTAWWVDLTALERVFVCLAFPFSLLTVFQLILELTGIGGDGGSHDTSDGHGGGLIAGGDDAGGFVDHFHFFSVRNMIYFLMMFGWTGLAFSKAGVPAAFSTIMGIIAGLLTTVIIGWIFYIFSRLTESGNVKIDSAIGQLGSVYLTIPPKREGQGIVQLVMQGVTQELNAITDGDKLQTGTAVEVKQVVGGNIVLVEKSVRS